MAGRLAGEQRQRPVRERQRLATVVDVDPHHEQREQRRQDRQAERHQQGAIARAPALQHLLEPVRGGTDGHRERARRARAAPGCPTPRRRPLVEVREVDPPEGAALAARGAAVEVVGTAFSRRAASVSRLARLRAARRCFEVLRLSGTVATVDPARGRQRPEPLGRRPRCTW